MHPADNGADDLLLGGIFDLSPCPDPLSTPESFDPAGSPASCSAASIISDAAADSAASASDGSDASESDASASHSKRQRSDEDANSSSKVIIRYS